MYFNSRGERVSRARWKEMYQAFLNRQELIKAGLTSRRDLMRLGLLTAAGMLIPKRGLSSWGERQLPLRHRPAAAPAPVRRRRHGRWTCRSRR